LGFEFYNLSLNTANPSNPFLQPIAAGPSYVVVVFPPQSLVEEAVFTTADPSTPAAPPAPMQSRLSGESRLAFQLLPGTSSIPFNSQSLLSWAQWGAPSIVPWAASQVTQDLSNPNPVFNGSIQIEKNGYPLIRPLTNVETQIELPWHLVLSPNETAQWEHSITPVAANGLTELWHTRLGIAVPGGGFTEAPGGNRNVRAIYALDADFQTNYNNGNGPGPTEAQDGTGNPPSPMHPTNFPQTNNPCGNTDVTDPFEMALFAGDRYDIVMNSSDYSLAVAPSLTTGLFGYTPTPVQDVNYLMLSGLGGFVDLDATWDNKNSNLVEWKHKATLGRDHYVKVVYRGYLMPTGHPAVLIEETKRTFEMSAADPSTGQGTYGAYLRKRQFIVIRQPVKDYPADGGAYGSANNQRQWPFRQIEITTLVTPDLAPQAPYFAASGATHPNSPPPPNCSANGTSGPGDTGPNQAYNPPFVPSIAQPGGPPVPFQFHFRGTDWGGVTHDFTSGVVFVFYTDALNVGNPTSGGIPNISAICKQYNTNGTGDGGNLWAGTTQDIKVSVFNGQKVNFAEVTRPNETALQTTSMTWGVEPPEAGVSGNSGVIGQFIDADQPQFYPVVRWAQVELRTAETVHGGGPLEGTHYVAISGAETTSSFNRTPNLNDFGLPLPSAGYLLSAFGTGNPSASFLTMVDDVGNSLEGHMAQGLAGPVPDPLGPALDFASNVSGGSLTPNLALSGLSRTTGLMAGVLNNVIGGVGLPGKLDPADFFNGANDPKILGAISLKSIIAVIEDLAGASSAQAMTVLSQEIPNPLAGVTGPGIPSVPSLPQIPGLPSAPSLPGAIDITFDWQPGLQDFEIFVRHPDASADIHGLIHTDLITPANSTTTITGSLKNFDIKLFPDIDLITVSFNELSFKQANAQKPQINVDIEAVTFDGPLNFVQTLEQFLSSLGLGGLSIDVTPTGVNATLSLALPDLSIGVFNLSNLSFGGQLNLPFTNNPARLRFNFCTQDNPFSLNVMFLGGGGFFAIALGLDGLEQVQASLEFGAQVSMNLGIASGGIEVYAGIYFSLTENNGQSDIDLTGFVKFGGQVSVLGIVSISITCTLSLSYDSGANTMTGTASIVIAVSLFCFSVHTSVQVQKTFGGGGDPTFQQAIPSQNVWNQYTAAFAPIGA
jgi:hypothetical protein